ncbi:MAG: hypothetical protein AAF654_11250 [Myxococcota bacterium]
MKTKLGVVIALLCAPVLAQALPPLQTTSMTEDDATVSLEIATQSIAGDVRSYCTVRARVESTLVPFTLGDTINVGVFEADFLSQTVFQVIFNVTQAEVQAGVVEREFDCSGDFQEESDGKQEIYALVSVAKEECKAFSFPPCLDDQPTTEQLDVLVLTDDDAEANDVQAQAAPLTLGSSASYIARNEDWHAVQVDSPSRLEVDVLHREGAGAVIVELYGADQSMVSSGVPSGEGQRLIADGLPPGTYGLKIAPAESEDYVFYGLGAVLEGVSTSCETGAVDSTPCGNCGIRTRTCVNGFWGPYSACGSEGVCTPGATNSDNCGTCGERVDRCSDSCEWVPGACFDGCAEGTASLGESCNVDANCVNGLDCLRAADYPAFVDGYCGLDSCTNNAVCGTSGVCAGVFGGDYCLKGCTDSVDCRIGYVCIDSANGRGCAPKCTGDEQCGDPREPVCDVGTGLCVSGSSRPGLSGQPPANGDGSGQLVTESGCAATPPLLVLLLGLRRRRRRR